MFERLKESLSPSGVPYHMSIVDAIKRDHDDLKEMIEILKDSDVIYAEKKRLYPDFAALLKSHSESEEKAVYQVCQKIEELRAETFEGLEEHHICEELMAKIQSTRSKEAWMARVKVLAELVEHHVTEEENDFLPELMDNTDQFDEKKMVDEFMSLRQQSQRAWHQDNAGVLDRVL